MSDIAAIDPNFSVSEAFGREDVVMRNCREEPFSVHGVFYRDGLFRRLPEEVAKTVNEGVLRTHSHTAGGRVRFVTDSPFVALTARMPVRNVLPHMPLTGVAGFDLYADGEYAGTFVPPCGFEGGYSGILSFSDCRRRVVTIDFPLYNPVSNLFVGLAADAALEPAPSYRHALPAVFYGSSITQGACASRPGTCYEAILSRRFDFDYVNLGFSGSAKGEDTIIEYLASMPCSVFFLDYDHNAPSPAHLAETHERLFRAFRKTHARTPVVMMSRPRARFRGDDAARREAVLATYRRAVAEGDRNVYFLDGAALTVLCGTDGLVDGTHPTDLGFASMAAALGDLCEREGLFA